MAYLPDRQWGVVMMGNTSRKSNYAQFILYFWLLDELLGTPVEERVDWNAKWKSVVAKRLEDVLRARERLYPDTPQHKRPASIPLDQYAGSYSHAGYGRMNLRAVGAHLIADRLEQEIAIEIRLEHVSGDLWLAYLQVQHEDPRDVEVVKAEFYVSADGKASRFGISLEPKMGDERMWFVRIDE